MSRLWNIAVLGATGLVGETLIKVLEEREFPVGELFPLASNRSLGKGVEFRGRDIPVIAKIEKPEALDNITGILELCYGLMVARGDGASGIDECLGAGGTDARVRINLHGAGDDAVPGETGVEDARKSWSDQRSVGGSGREVGEGARLVIEAMSRGEGRHFIGVMGRILRAIERVVAGLDPVHAEDFPSDHGFAVEFAHEVRYGFVRDCFAREKRPGSGDIAVHIVAVSPETIGGRSRRVR